MALVMCIVCTRCWDEGAAACVTACQMLRGCALCESATCNRVQGSFLGGLVVGMSPL